MKVMMKKDLPSYFSSEPRKNLKKGTVWKVLIEEYNKDEHPDKDGFYLLETNFEHKGNYVSDKDASLGYVIRIYIDPNLPNNYKDGNYFWISKNFAEPFIENNQGAKFMLEKEWS